MEIGMNILADMIQKDPNLIVKPISIVFGWILNFIFNIISIFTSNYTLGFSIIVLTILTRLCLLPLAFKQQKSMFIMQKLQPEMTKIQKKYENRTQDPEVQRKMNMELQKLYAEKGYNPLAGCLPMLIQFPIFIALYYIMRNPYLFIDKVNMIYTEIANVLLSSTDYVLKAIVPFAYDIIPDRLRGENGFDLMEMQNLIKVISKLTPSQWTEVQAIVPGLDDALSQKNLVETFFGLNLTETVGWHLNTIFIPVVSGLTTFLSSWIITRKNKPADKNMKTQQRVMNITMPLIMAYITTGLPAGVGLYWITSNIVLIFQQVLISRHYEKQYKSASK